MKHIVTLSLLMSLTFVAKSQDTIYNYTYHAEDYSVSLFSDDVYEIVTAWSPESEKDEIHTEYFWSKGNIEHKHDTLICVDSTNYKKIYILKESDDIIKIIKWDDYKDRDDEGNWFVKWDDDYDNKKFLDDFITQNNILYLGSINEGTKKLRSQKLLKAFTWKSGKKKLFYEDGIGVIKDGDEVKENQ